MEVMTNFAKSHWARGGWTELMKVQMIENACFFWIREQDRCLTLRWGGAASMPSGWAF